MIGASIGDTHLGVSLKGYDLTPSTRRVMFSFLRFCERNKAGYAVHLGDLFETCRPSTAALKLSMQWCRRFSMSGIRLFLLTGNHDVLSRPGNTSALDPIKAAPLPGVQVVDRPRAVRISSDTALALLPFPASTTYSDVGDWRAQVRLAVRSARSMARTVVVYSHLEVDGALASSGHPVAAGRFELPPEVLYLWGGSVVFNGHHHVEQESHLQGATIYMQGSAQRTDLGERDTVPQFYLVGARGRLLSKEEAPAVPMRQVELDATSASHGGSPVTTRDMLDALSHINLRDAVVKVVPMVDDGTAVDWSEVEAEVLSSGAVHVYPIVPVRTSAKPRPRKRSAMSVGRLAQEWIRSRVRSKKERVALWGLFKQLKSEVEHK